MVLGWKPFLEGLRPLRGEIPAWAKPDMCRSPLWDWEIDLALCLLIHFRNEK